MIASSSPIKEVRKKGDISLKAFHDMEGKMSWYIRKGLLAILGKRHEQGPIST